MFASVEYKSDVPQLTQWLTVFLEKLQFARLGKKISAFSEKPNILITVYIISTYA